MTIEPSARSTISIIPTAYDSDEEQELASSIQEPSHQLSKHTPEPTDRVSDAVPSSAPNTPPPQNPPICNNVAQNAPDQSLQPPPDRKWADLKEMWINPDLRHLAGLDLASTDGCTPRIPCHIDKDGNTRPRSRLWERSDLLPGTNEPLHEHLLCYAQRWSCWAATIKDDNRRNEVLDWATRRMYDAWSHGINNGFYPSESSKLGLASKSKRGRQLDLSKQLASFTSDPGNKKPPNAIINAELEAIGVSMETILHRVGTGDLEVGYQLLRNMIETLGRDLDLSDWTTLQGRKPVFNPLIHKRNLYMYSLWESQRCQRIVDQCKLQLCNRLTLHQSKGIQARLDAHEQRAIEHLALAIEIDLKESNKKSNEAQTIPSDDEPNAEDFVDEMSDQQSHSGSSRESEQTRTTPSSDGSSSLESSDDSKEGNSSKPEETELATSSVANNVLTEINYHNQFDHFNDAGNSSITNGISQVPEPSSAQYNSQHPRSSFLRVSKRPQHEDSDVVIPSKRSKLNDNLKPACEATTGNRSFQDLITQNHNPQNLIATAQAAAFQLPASYVVNHGQLPPIPQPALPTASPTPLPTTISADDQQKRSYLQQVWEPRVNELLQQAGFPYRTIRQFRDVKRALFEMGYGVVYRNEATREYKAGLESFCRTTGQPVTTNAQYTNVTDRSLPHARNSFIIKIPAKSIQDLESHSDKRLNESRGFAFRCLPFASIEQRERLDLIAHDYITDTVVDPSLRKKKSGKYVVLHDPLHPDRMAIGHGFWNKPRGVRAEDSEWFYEGQPIPEDLDIEVWQHVNALIDVPETPRSAPIKLKLTNKNAPNVHTRESSRAVSTGYDQKKRYASKKPVAQHTGSRPAARRSRRVVNDSDDDFDPRKYGY